MALSSFWWQRSGPRVSIRHCGLLIAGTALLVPHIHLHDVTILAFPPVLAATARFSAEREDWDVPVVALAFASLLLTLMAVSPAPVFDLCLAGAVLLIVRPPTPPDWTFDSGWCCDPGFLSRYHQGPVAVGPHDRPSSLRRRGGLVRKPVQSSKSSRRRFGLDRAARIGSPYRGTPAGPRPRRLSLSVHDRAWQCPVLGR